MPLWMCALIWCQDVWLTGQREICHVLERTWSTYSHSFLHLCFLLPKCRIRNSWKDGKCSTWEQKTSGGDVRAWALYPINSKVVMEKETCLTLSHRGQLPLIDKMWFLAQRWRKPLSISGVMLRPLQCPLSSFPPRVLFFFSVMNSPKDSHSPSHADHLVYI